MDKALSLVDIPFPETSTIERQFLSDCVGNSESMPDFMSIVDESMFTNESRLYIWRTLVWMFNNGHTIDLASVTALTGKHYIDEVVMHRFGFSTPLDALQHASYLRACAVKRRAYRSAISLLQTVTQANTGELDVYESAQQIMTDIQGERPLVAEASMPDILKAVDAEVKENKVNNENGKRTRIPTGFPTLDALTYNGWRPGQLIILAARPSIGKTAIMLQMAKSAAKSGFPVTIFSLEMTKEELGQRLLFSTGRVSPLEIAMGTVSELNYRPAQEELRQLPIFINDESRSLDGIISRISVSVTKGRCRVVFIDYLGLVSVDETGRMPLNQQIATATRELKNTAKRQRIPIILLCQLNREAAKEDGAPQLYHLRDSGAIEQDADIALMLEQVKMEITDSNGNTRPGLPDINIWVRKNRQFQKDIKVVVRPNDSYSAFYEVSQPGTIPPPVNQYDTPGATS